ncbi:MAG: ABC transporter permease [Chitinophagia bacterium]
MQNFIQKYRYSYILLKELVKTDFKLRYQGSILGYMWSLLRPLFLFVILYIVFVRLLKVGSGIPHYPVYLLLGIVIWNYFAEVTAGGVSSIVGRGDLLRKINFPKYVILLSVSLSGFINLVLNFIVIAIFMFFSGVTLGYSAFLIVPIIIELFIFSLGVSFLLSTLYVKFRDVSYIWEVIMQAAFYATPIIYSLNILSDRFQKLLLLNPMAQIIQEARYVLITKKTITIEHVFKGNLIASMSPIILVIVITILSSLYFKRKSKNFAEEI